MSNPRPPGLQQFLDDEVTAVALEHLLEKALAARRNRVVEAYSGNAYHVAFEEDAVVIEHHYREDWPALRLPLDSFIETLQGWQPKARY
ncbi:hypothetical protein PUR31_08425 [Pseudomonas mosselii]|uniref:hypothetical protein n=1 Tax=unclassified Pseudomonas TaxID=196821 RepID=UPI001943A659|nr:MULTISPECIES: hypothetical protein [unclassified Pseudomonas]MDC0689978.1 hypothetical protein [Mitsuaria sp. RG]MCF1489573.1 hypothetical protein [Pseudomonas sp. AA27]MCP8634809.1 hypothetical protein [Pseudomonas sp. DVZ6]MDD7784110.1 hypothetical protein [Pseudomonas sp. DVZ24]BCJ07812.1 hypothetical protein PRtIB026_A24980 [Pseudomonas sp. RtIB026]